MTDGNENATPQYLSAVQVATRFSVSPRTVRRWAESKAIPFMRTPGGELRFPVQLLDDWARDSERVAKQWFANERTQVVAEEKQSKEQRGDLHQITRAGIDLDDR